MKIGGIAGDIVGLFFLAVIIGILAAKPALVANFFSGLAGLGKVAQGR